ncbi:MAG: radical SAM protein, partial [Bacteroidales bacterium]|nr:radical SAM protein [Bacteroidales bacterium]
EHTILELMNCLQQQKEWTGIHSISFMKEGEVVHTTLSALEPDLDSFPFPFRSGLKEFALEKKYATLIAGRGCVYNCAFCDIRAFYGQPPGPVKRIRKPEMVVNEMEHLYKEHDCSIFLFQDDDFPVAVSRNSQWIDTFCRSLEERDLAGKVMWKINCRSDEVDDDLFGMMKQYGLFKVYLGIENGTDEGLIRMNKRLTVADNIRGIEILKDLGIAVDYGFMLFHPDSTYNSINDNLAFLAQICGDGYLPVSFLKMMPYLETKVEKELRLAGRLKGRPGFLDYDFHEASMNDMYAFVSDCFASWFHGADGATNLTKWAVNYLAVYTFFYGVPEGIQNLSEELRILVVESNRFIIHTMQRLTGLFESGNCSLEKNPELEAIKVDIEEKHANTCTSLKDIISKVGLYAHTKDLINWT